MCDGKGNNNNDSTKPSGGGHRRVPSSSDYTQSWENSVAEAIRYRHEQFSHSLKSVAESPPKETIDGSSGPSVTFHGDYDGKNQHRPYMVALVGTPGSGKSVSSMILANILDNMGLQTCIMPHDGYHYPLSTLRLWPDPQDAIYRRGAPDTFDPEALHRDLIRIRDGDEDIIAVPGFDHAKGDPEPDRHIFDRANHKVVLCEGLYLLHDQDGWDKIPGLFDFSIFINSDIDQCMERVSIRNQCIPGYTPEEIKIRVERVDRPNARTVMACRDRAHMVVESAVVTTTHKESPTSMGHKKSESNVSLAALALDIAELPHHQGETILMDHDWTMDIVSRPRGESVISMHESLGGFGSSKNLNYRERSESIVSSTIAPEDVEPVSHDVGRWESNMAMQIVELLENSPDTLDGSPFMVALAAGPGSGKTLSCMLLAQALEDELGYPCMIMPMDGYHYPLETLRTWPDPVDAIYRRGAPDTFDTSALMRDLNRIKTGVDEDIIKLPAFDHARADPEPDTHIFDRNKHKVVICEGLYLLHDADRWEGVADFFDFKIYMDTDLETCMERVKIRNQCIPGYTPEEIAARVEDVDRINALTVEKSKQHADVVITLPTH